MKKKKVKFDADITNQFNKNNISYPVNIKLMDIIVVIIIIIPIVVIGCTLYHEASKVISDSPEEITSAFEHATDSITPYSINFNSISTTEKEYEKLRIECNKYMEKLKTVDDEVQVSVEGSGQDFVDSAEDEEVTADDIEDDNTKHETGPIYFQDKLLIRYIDRNGQMIISASSFENNEIITKGRDELTDIFENTSVNNNEDIKNMSEEQYMYNVISFITEAVTKNSDELDNEFRRRALVYFTYDGYNTILDSKKALNLDKNESISVDIAEMGKSTTELETKDRILLKLSVNGSDKDIQSVIIIKLNNNFKVFDIDVI